MEVRLTLAEIGSHGFPRVSCYGHRGEQVDNGRKWQEMVEKWSKIDFRGYLVGNGFPRVLRHSPTTAKAYDNDPDINKIFANDDSDDSSSESEYVDIDEFEYDEDGHAIFPF